MRNMWGQGGYPLPPGSGGSDRQWKNLKNATHFITTKLYEFYWAGVTNIPVSAIFCVHCTLRKNLFSSRILHFYIPAEKIPSLSFPNVYEITFVIKVWRIIKDSDTIVSGGLWIVEFLTRGTKSDRFYHKEVLQKFKKYSPIKFSKKVYW